MRWFYCYLCDYQCVGRGELYNITNTLTKYIVLQSTLKESIYYK